MAGFKEDPKRRVKKEIERITSHTFHRGVPGDVAVMIPQALTKLGLKFKEVASHKIVFGTPTTIPFIHQTTADGLDIPFGSYEIEGIGVITPNASSHEIVPELQLSVNFIDASASAREGWEALVKAIEAGLADRSKSMFFGKAVRILQPSDLLVPRYIDTSADVALYLNPDVEEAIDDHVFFHIREFARLKREGIRTQRGVLLHGPYGTGKSLVAYKAAKISIEHGRTFVLCTIDMFRIALDIARFMQPSTLFIEDMDGLSNSRLSELRNLMSGVESKRGYDVLAILTTNFLDKVVKADRSFMRPERIDALIEVPAPNAVVIERMIREQGAGFIDPEVDWAEAATIIASKHTTAAIVLEMLNRAKVKSMKLNRPLGFGEVGAIYDGLSYQVELATPVMPSPDNDQTQFIKLFDKASNGELAGRPRG